MERPSNLSAAAMALEETPTRVGCAVAIPISREARDGAVATGCELSVEGIRKHFGSVIALDGVALTIARGEFVTILGPSGCGKTTLLRIIAGLEIADAGLVSLGGVDITRLPANRRPVNTVFQNYALFPHLNVWENIAFGLRARKYPAEEIDRRVGSALEMLHLEDLPARPIHQLSGGQKQRVALARALVNEPDVLLLDEPMSALDAKLRAEVQLELRRLQRRIGKTFVLVTHDQNEAMTVSDRIFVMREGRIVQAGPPAQVYDRPVNRFVAEFLGTTNLIPAWRENGSVHTEIGDFAPRQHPAWDRGVLSIRPERIVVRRERPSANGIRATVTEVIYRGDHLDVYVEPASLHLRSAPGSFVLKPGQEVWLELPTRYLEALSE